MSANQNTSRRKIFLTASPVLFLVLVILALLVAHASGEGRGSTTHYVDDDAPAGGNGSLVNPFNRIQDAVNASVHGDTIRVFEGTYFEHIVINRTVELIGNGSDETEIDGQGDGYRIVEINAEGVEISGFTVTGAGKDAPLVAGIWVAGNNSKIFQNKFSDNDNGILIESAHNVIEENVFTGNSLLGNGVQLYQYYGYEGKVINNTIAGNTFSDNYYGIFIHRCNENRIIDNTCTNNSFGIALGGSSYNLVHNNSLSRNGGDIFLEYAYYSTITNNTCSYPQETEIGGISMWDSEYIILRNNNMTSSGFIIGGDSPRTWNTHIIDTTNEINGKSLIYFKNETGAIIPHDAGPIILANCSSMNIRNMDFKDYRAGIQVAFSSNITVFNNTFSRNHDGMRIRKSKDISIFDNSLINNFNIGISVLDCDNTVIMNNTCDANDNTGISLASSYKDSSTDNTVTNNICTNNSNSGISLVSTDLNTLSNNTLNNNEIGLILERADFNIIANCTISGNEFGVSIKGASQQNKFRNNSITDSQKYGMDATNNDAYLVYATHNWWGDNSGPFHIIRNPDGKGDEVTDHIEFDPWTGKDEDEQKLPDLIIKSISVDPSNPREGELVKISIEILNTGNAPAEDISLNILSKDMAGNEESRGILHVGDLPPGGNITDSVFWNTTYYFGLITITAMIDLNNTVIESDETNNLHEFNVYVQEAPEKYGVEIRSPVYLFELNENEEKVVTLTLRNLGQFTDSYNLSISGNYQGWIIDLEQIGKIVLTPGAEMILNLTISRYQEQNTSLERITVTITMTSDTYKAIHDSVIIEGYLENPDEDDSGILPRDIPPLAGIVAGTTGVVIIASFLGLYEPSRYKFFSLLIPLYTRLKKEGLEELENRKEILGFIKGRPGANYSTIMNALEIGNGTLSYHLKVLEDNRVIKSRVDANKKRFYPHKFTIEEKREQIIDILKYNPGLSQKDVIGILRMSRRKTGRRLADLVESGKLRIEKVGRENHYFIMERVTVGNGHSNRTLTDKNQGEENS